MGCRTASDGYDECALIAGALCTEIKQESWAQSGPPRALLLFHMRVEHDFLMYHWVEGQVLCIVFFSFCVGDAGNTSLVDAGTALGATAVVTPGSAGYLLWEWCILASL